MFDYECLIWLNNQNDILENYLENIGEIDESY